MENEMIIKKLEQTSKALKELDDALSDFRVWLEYECEECSEINFAPFKMFDIALELDKIKRNYQKIT